MLIIGEVLAIAILCLAVVNIFFYIKNSKLKRLDILNLKNKVKEIKEINDLMDQVPPSKELIELKKVIDNKMIKLDDAINEFYKPKNTIKTKKGNLNG